MTELTNEKACEIASTFTWKQLQSRFEQLHSKSGESLRATLIRTTWESGEISTNLFFGGDSVRQKEFEQLASIASRKLGYLAIEDEDKYWINRMREWMQSEGLDKSVAWLPTGTVYVGGRSGTTQSFETDRITELSGLFCIELMKHGTPESFVSQPLETAASDARRAIDIVGVTLADDFRSIQIDGIEHTLTKNQGLMMSVLLEAHRQERKFVPEKKLCEAMGTLKSNPRDSWRKSRLWRTVVKAEKGRYWLDLPTAHTPVSSSRFDRENTS